MKYIIALIMAGLLLGCAETPVYPNETCEELGGEWHAPGQACTGITQLECTEANGVWENCMSACELDGTEVCTKQCIGACRLPYVNSK